MSGVWFCSRACLTGKWHNWIVVDLHAKIVFMIGMYWCARSPETERIRMRGFKVAGWMEFGSEGATSGSALVLEDVVVERAMDCLLI